MPHWAAVAFIACAVILPLIVIVCLVVAYWLAGHAARVRVSADEGPGTDGAQRPVAISGS